MDLRKTVKKMNKFGYKKQQKCKSFAHNHLRSFHSFQTEVHDGKPGKNDLVSKLLIQIDALCQVQSTLNNGIFFIFKL